jgi:hypothetical protein
MGVYAELNDNNIVVNIIQADENFVNSLPNKDSYILSDGKKLHSMIGSEYVPSVDCFRLEKEWTTFVWSDSNKDWIAPTDGITPFRHAESSDRSDIAALYLQYEDYFDVSHVTQMLEDLSHITYDPTREISHAYNRFRTAKDFFGYDIPENSAIWACAYKSPGEGTVAVDYYNEFETWIKLTYGIEWMHGLCPIKNISVTKYCEKLGMTSLHSYMDDRVVNGKTIGETHIYGKNIS